MAPGVLKVKVGEVWESILTSSTGGGGVADVLHVGPDAPTDSSIELWADTDAVATGGGGGTSALPSTCEGRLTTESGVPVSITDRVAQSTLYFTPYRGNRVSLYTSGAWTSVAFSQVSLALTGLTSGRPYDVWLYNNAGTPALEVLAWTNDTTRATALALQDGIYVKTGDATRRYVGTMYTTGATTTEDSEAKRYVWNAWQRVRRTMVVKESANSWAYPTNAWRQANANAANQLDFVVGLVEDSIEAMVHGLGYSTSGNEGASTGIGVDSTTVNSAQGMGTNTGGSWQTTTLPATYRGWPGIGRHRLVWLERGSGNVTFQGDHNAPDNLQASIGGTLWG